VSPTGRYTTIVPLGVVLIASAFKEIQEDLVRLMMLDWPSHPDLNAAETAWFRSINE